MIVIVLRDHVQPTRVIDWAAERGWPCVEDVARGHDVRATVRWETAEGTDIAYIEDHKSDVRFIQFRGRQQHILYDDLVMRLPCYREDELLIAAESNPDPRERIRALNRLAACRPCDVHHRYLTVWARALADPNTAVRRAAIRTAHGCAWPELGYVLRQRIAQEQRLAPQMRALLDEVEHASRAE